ncbi:MAG: flagellar hook-basal body complex protein FliE [Rhodobacteraceae bacterium]|nr:flagellar hook-basal body complex protein FliE [Paracoccaceae bacterium]
MNLSPLAAAQAYAGTRALTRPDPAPGAGPETGPLAAAATHFAATLARGEDTARAVMAGRADPHALVQALSEAELAIETAVTLRDRVVEAYQEILRMPV